jgi:hypothetical protein
MSDVYAHDATPPKEVCIIPSESAIANGGTTTRFIKVPDDFHRLLELALVCRSGGLLYSSHLPMRIMYGKIGEAYNTHDTGIFYPPTWNVPADVIGEINLVPYLPAPLEPRDIVNVWIQNLNSSAYIYVLGLRLKYR